MVYTFETGDVYSPVLTAEANGSSAIYRIEPKAGEDAVSANTYWKLYPYNQYSYPSIFDEEFTINDKPKKVIDAIRDGTIHLASTEDKQRLWNLLSAPQSGNPAPAQSGTKVMSATSTEPAVNNVVDPEQLVKDTIYVMFVAAQNELGGEPVFAMVEGISKHDNEGPKIINVTERIYDITDDTINVSVTIEFNSDIYLRKPNTIPPQTKPYNLFKDFSTDILYSSPIDGSTAEIKDVTPRTITVLIKNSIKNTDFSIIPIQKGYESLICSETGIARGSISIKIVEDKNGKLDAVINGGKYNGLTSELDE